MDVGVELLAPRLSVPFGDGRAEAGVGRVVDQHVEAAKGLDGRGDEPIEVVAHSHVGSNRQRRATLPLDRLDRLADRPLQVGAWLDRAGGDDDLGAAPSELVGNLSPDATAGARDDRHLPVQVHGRMLRACSTADSKAELSASVGADTTGAAALTV